jgi:DNA-binding NtrC family response regulator
VNVRIIAATNRDLDAEVKAGRFREDLYYRLRVIELQIPPLRERQEDIMPLAHFFLEKTSQAMGRGTIGFMPKVADQLLGYAWPGNVRQLQNTVEHAVTLCNGKRISLNDLPRELLSVQRKTDSPESIRPLDDVEREHILASLQLADGDKVLASRRLGISLSTLYNKLKGYGAA